MNARTPLRIVRVCDGLVVGEVSNVCIVVWRGPVNRVRFDAQRDGLAEVIARHPERAGFLCVIEPTADPPNDELRRASAEMIRRSQGGLRCIACIVEGTGFRSAIARSALSGIALILGTRQVPFSVFGTVSAATTWMAPHVDMRDAAAIASAVEAVREEL
jgi:hypothetical protein